MRHDPTILFDIDDTITGYLDHQDDYVAHLRSYLSDKIAKIRDISVGESSELLENYMGCRNVWWDYPDLMVDFGLDLLSTWDDLRQLNREHFHRHEDAIELVKELSSSGANLYIISNNPVTGCLMKLEIAGLGDLSGTPHFRRIFGTNVIRGMKSQVTTWRRVVANLAVEPDRVFTIGDHIDQDCRIPAMAGIGQTIIINRLINESSIEMDGYICVNNLTNALEFLR